MRDDEFGRVCIDWRSLMDFFRQADIHVDHPRASQ